MKAAEAFNLCEAAVRKFDADRYFATLFAPAGKRRLLYALYAFNHELAWAGETTREPVAAAIRLRWWRDVLLCAADGNPPAHPVAVALAEVFQAGFGGSADL